MRWIWAILVAGVVAGLLDQTSAFASLVPHGATTIGILHYVASGLIGVRAFSGGVATAILGLAVQLSLTTIMASIFVAASRKYPGLLRRPWLSGVTYGVAICFLMNFVAVPLSAAPNWKPPQGWALVEAIMGVSVYVGVPIAFIARAFLAPRASER